MIRCVVFDFDGVLVDSNAAKRQAYTDIFSGFGPPGATAVEAVLRADTEDDRFGVIRAILSALPNPPNREELDRRVAEHAERYNLICEEFTATCPEIPGATAALERLARSHSLYVISATPQEPLRRVVARRGWSAHFRGVLGRPAGKPENLARVMRGEGIDGGKIVFVGDGRRDLEAAQAAGCLFVGVRNRFNDFDSADLTMIDDLRSLPELIERPVPARSASQAG
jgi:phosphoglycolate phosphatase-like HAD superfamily hydrolase